MKASIHPKWYPEAQVSCACGNKFTIGSTMEEIKVEICAKCHPFYTGQMRYLDTTGRVDRFKARQDQTINNNKQTKKLRREEKKKQKVEEELSRPTTLGQLRSK
jgi:large subunit ribosomal protein L31